MGKYLILVSKKCFLVLCFCLSWVLNFAQNKPGNSFNINSETVRGCKEFRADGGACSFVIELLRSSQCNDSIAIDLFKKEYEIVNMRSYDRDWLNRQNYIKVIQIFSLEENKKYYCKSKYFKGFEPVLLITDKIDNQK